MGGGLGNTLLSSASWAEQLICRQPKPSKSHHTINPHPQTPNGIFVQDALRPLTHPELDRKSLCHS